MTYFEAALIVLKQFNKPMTAGQITDEAIKRHLINPSGKTPERTMSAVLYLRAKAADRIAKMAKTGKQRAQRGSVRWSINRNRTRRV